MKRNDFNKSDDAIKDPVKDAEVPTGMFVFFCWGDGILSRLITKVTDGPSHTGFGFIFAAREAEYYEALFTKGVKGPILYSRVEEWLLESPETRKLECIDITGLSPASLAAKQQVARTYVGTAGYGELQLLAMYLFERFGRRVKTSTSHVVCSEFAARVLLPEIDVTTRDCDLDEVSPAYLYKQLQARFPGGPKK